MPAASYIGSTNLASVYRYIRSVHLVETAGTPAPVRIQLKDTDTNGEVYITLAAPASGSAVFTPAKPIRFPGGVRLEFVTGSGRCAIDGY
jgi:hypothetical protein